ncbi:UNVERIFIED_CONTAM: hypothetical protein FKN15_027216 [Acipenser sinensis]
MILNRAQEATAEKAKVTRTEAKKGAGAGAMLGAGGAKVGAGEVGAKIGEMTLAMVGARAGATGALAMLGAGPVVGAGACVIVGAWVLAKARPRSTEGSWFTRGSGVAIWTSSDTATQDSRGVPETPAPPPPPDAGKPPKPKVEVVQQLRKRKVKPDKESPTPASLDYTRPLVILIIFLLVLVVYCSQSNNNPAHSSHGAQKTNQQNKKGASYENFKNSHLITANVHADKDFCDKKMINININRNRNGKCKRLNTFILSSEASVEDVCKDGGEDWVKPGKRGNLKISKDRFKVIDCVVIDVNQEPSNCRYTTLNINNPMHIIVACINGNPVHFEGKE